MVATLAETRDGVVGWESLLQMPLGEQKSKIVQGNYALAAQKVFRWYDERNDYITAKGSLSREEVYSAEKDELSIAMDTYWEDIVSERSMDIPWYEDEGLGGEGNLADKIWLIASEAADVAIVMASELKRDGYDAKFVEFLWSGVFDTVRMSGNLEQFRDDIRNVRNSLTLIGVDLAEAISMKSALNEQHYPSAFWPWVFIDKIGMGNKPLTFARRLRNSIGRRTDSQMPDLMMTGIGETSLSRLQRSPFGSNGNSPKAIYISDQGEVELAPSDMDHTYEGLYAIGTLEWLFDDHEQRFPHLPEIADFYSYFSKAEWLNLMNRLKEVGIEELVVPSGSGFRFNSLKALAKFYELSFENVGEVEDELKWLQYRKWCVLQKRNPDIFEYQQFVAEGKHARLDKEHDKYDVKHDHKAVVAAMDEIIMWWNKNTGTFEAIEKPENEEQAIQQILRLVSGEKFVVSNATVIGPLAKNGVGEGITFQLIPIRVVCKDDDARIELAQKWLKLYQKARRKEGKWKVTPGGISLLHHDLQPYMAITLPKNIEETVVPPSGRLRYVDYIQYLNEKGEETMFLDLPESKRNLIGIAVGGMSLLGLKAAISEYLSTRMSWGREITADWRREARLNNLEAMMTL